MTNPTPTQAIQTVPTPMPQLPDITQIPLDPSNPLICFLVLATLLTATEKPLNAIANLLRAIRPFIRDRQNRK